jgi:hypothetical protein
MKRREVKKQIKRLEAQLVVPAQKYLAATRTVHKDVIYKHELRLEHYLMEILNLYLMLDPSWPHQERWLDGFDGDVGWEKTSDALRARDMLWWGHLRNIMGQQFAEKFEAKIWFSKKGSLIYSIKFGDGKTFREFPRRKKR